METVETDNNNQPRPGPGHLDVLPGVESGPGPLLVLISPAQVSFNSLGLLSLGTLQTGLGLHVVREGEMVDNLLELSLGHIGSQAAGYLLTVAFALFELQLVGDKEESPLKYLSFDCSLFFLVWCTT